MDFFRKRKTLEAENVSAAIIFPDLKGLNALNEAFSQVLIVFLMISQIAVNRHSKLRACLHEVGQPT